MIRTWTSFLLSPTSLSTVFLLLQQLLCGPTAHTATTTQNQEIRCTISSDVITLYIPLYHALHNPLLHSPLSRPVLYEIWNQAGQKLWSQYHHLVLATRVVLCCVGLKGLRECQVPSLSLSRPGFKLLGQLGRLHFLWPEVDLGISAHGQKQKQGKPLNIFSLVLTRNHISVNGPLQGNNNMLIRKFRLS